MKPTERTLLVDIETFPMLMYAWTQWEADALRVIENTSICAWSAKWLHGKQITRCLADYKGYKPHRRDDKTLLQELWQLLDEADIVVAHNGDAFDVKKINYRFLLHGMKPPSPYRTVDTLKEARKIAAFDSNKLNELSRLLDIGQKIRTGGADLWFDCLEGNMNAWKHMKEYNARDVSPLLEQVYLKLLPYMKTHPNVANGYGPDMCPKCGGTHLRSEGIRRNATTAYRRLHCIGCGSWIRDTTNLIQKDDKPFVIAA
jgi:hypothetical protein